jgi:hypothetical protein
MPLERVLPGNTLPRKISPTRRWPDFGDKPYLQRILDRIDAPAIVMTPTHDLLAWHPSPQR